MRFYSAATQILLPYVRMFLCFGCCLRLQLFQRQALHVRTQALQTEVVLVLAFALVGIGHYGLRISAPDGHRQALLPPPARPVAWALTGDRLRLRHPL